MAEGFVYVSQLNFLFKNKTRKKWKIIWNQHKDSNLAKKYFLKKILIFSFKFLKAQKDQG